MSQQLVGTSRTAQGSAGAIINANDTELYNRQLNAAATLTANGTFTVPAGYLIEHVAIVNTTANAVTGGLNFGTAAAGSDVVAAFAVGANAVTVVPGASVLKRLFSTSADQTIYVSAASAWNSASVKLSVILRKVY